MASDDQAVGGFWRRYEETMRRIGWISEGDPQLGEELASAFEQHARRATMALAGGASGGEVEGLTRETFDARLEVPGRIHEAYGRVRDREHGVKKLALMRLTEAMNEIHRLGGEVTSLLGPDPRLTLALPFQPRTKVTYTYTSSVERQSEEFRAARVGILNAKSYTAVAVHLHRALERFAGIAEEQRTHLERARATLEEMKSVKVEQVSASYRRQMEEAQRVGGEGPGLVPVEGRVRELEFSRDVALNLLRSARSRADLVAATGHVEELLDGEVLGI